MASERQVAANRANAKRSTGPKTVGGRRASSRNALRHGLCSSKGPRPCVSVDVDDLAEALIQQGTDQDVTARQIAGVHVELLRIRAVRAELLASLNLKYCNSDDLWQLLALDRYERVARGKRRRAARGFCAD
jgi:hypothetical protein